MELPTGTITFLFTDIQGSTGLWEQDARAMHLALERHNTLLGSAIHRHGGLVFKFVGDSLQAAFQLAPHALTAACEAQRALQQEDWGGTGPLLVRMGIHVGPAERIGDDYLASHTLNRVARVMSAGHGGQILLSLAAAELVREHLSEGIALLDLGEYVLKGMRHPERIYQVVAPGLPADFPPLVAPPSESITLPEVTLPQRMVQGRLVGRHQLVVRLREFWQRAASGSGHVLILRGEAGLGKTRVLGELARTALEQGGYVLLGECFAEEESPLTPFAQALRGLFGSPADSRTGARWSSRLGGIIPDLLELIPEYRNFFPDMPTAPPMSPDMHRRRHFEAWTILLEGLAAEQPLMLMLDDIQWADETSLDLILHLARRLSNHRLLIAGTFRAGSGHPQLRQLLSMLDRQKLLEEITLEPLNPSQVAVFVDELAGGAANPSAEFLDALFQRTEGNPLFIEELLKALSASAKPGGWTAASLEMVGIPRTVRETFLWQLDRLGETARTVAAWAAVVGRRFDYDFLAAVAQLPADQLAAGVRDLASTQIIFEQAVHGALAYSFRHPLMHEVIYQRLPGIERRQRHALIAKELEQRSGFDLARLQALRTSLPIHWWPQHKNIGVPPEVDQLARHYLLAGDWDKAYQFAFLAAEKNEATYSLPGVLRMTEEALRLVKRAHVTPEPASLTDLYTMRLAAQWPLGMYSAGLADGEIALKMAREQGDRLREAEILHFLSHVRTDQGLYAEADHLARQALAITEELGDQAGIAHMLVNLGETYISGVLGERDEGLAFLERARPLCEAIGDQLGIAHIELEEGHLYLLRAKYQEALDHLTKAVDLSRNLRDANALTRSLNYLGIVQRDLGRYEESLATLQEAWRVSDEGHIETQAAFALANLGGLRILQGDFQEALELAQRSVRQLEKIQANSLLPFALSVQGDVYRELGETELALESYGRALPIARQVNDPCWESFALAGRGLTRLSSKNLEPALDDLKNAFAVCQRSRDVYARATVQSLIRLAAGHLSSTEPEQATRLAREALEMATAARIPDQEAESRRVLGLVHAARGEWPQAEAELLAGLQIVAGHDLHGIAWRFHRALAELYLKAGEVDKARQQRDQAAELVERLSKQVGEEAMRKSFLRQPDIQSMLGEGWAGQ